MDRKNEFWKYILLAGIREYGEKNKFSIHKFNFYIIYSLITMMLCYTALFIGVSRHCIADIILILILLVSFQAVEFDNYVSFCQDTNNKVLMSYPVECSNILMVNSLKYLIFHLRLMNLGVLPFAIVILYFGHGILFIGKFYILMNTLSILACLFGWGRWIFKWQEVKLKKKSIVKDIVIVSAVIVLLFIVNLIKKQQLFSVNIIDKIKILNQDRYNFYEQNIYWIICIFVLISCMLIFKYIKSKILDIYEFYILNSDKNKINNSKEKNYFETFLTKQNKFSIQLKKEFYSIVRNSNIYNEVMRKIKYSIILPVIVSIYYLINPFNIDFYSISIFIIISINGYGDKIIRNFLSISSEGKMVINYIQSNTDIKKIITNKVNMLFLYRQLFIVGPLIFAITVTKFDILKLIYFIMVWIIMSYTSANIKIYSVSINTKFLTTEDFFKKMNVHDLIKYIVLESSYYYLLFTIVTLCRLFISNSIIIVIGILWISIIYNFVVRILQGDGKKFYGEFKTYI